MIKLLENKNAIVTGAGRGIGREIALALANQGAKVVVNDLGCAMDGSNIDQTPSDQVVAEIRQLGGTAIANYDTVADFSAAHNIIDSCATNFGNVDILVNLAATGRTSMVYEMSQEDWHDMIAVHLDGTFYCCRHACALMRQQVKSGKAQGGRIINFTSDVWRGQATMTMSHYAAAKGGIVSLTMAIAQEMKRYGVTCNAIAPIAATRMSKRTAAPEAVKFLYNEGFVERLICEEMLDLPGTEHIPAIVAYLASNHAANISGHMFGASRGRVALYSKPVEVKGLYKEGVWTPEELIELVPKIFLQ